MEINQCYQDHADAFRSHFDCCRDDFDEFDDDEEWEEYQLGYLRYSQLLEKSARTDVHIVTDEEESDVKEQEVGISSSQRPADVFQLESDIEDDVPDLPPFTAVQLEPM